MLAILPNKLYLQADGPLYRRRSFNIGRMGVTHVQQIAQRGSYPHANPAANTHTDLLMEFGKKIGAEEPSKFTSTNLTSKWPQLATLRRITKVSWRLS